MNSSDGIEDAGGRETAHPRALHPATIIEQGHFDVEVVSRTDRRPGLRGWYIQTKQKYIEGYAHEDDGHLLVALWPQEGRTLHLRDGEDGSVATLLGLRMPRARFGRRWDVMTWPGRYGIHVLAWTTWCPSPSPLGRALDSAANGVYRLRRRYTPRPSSDRDGDD